MKIYRVIADNFVTNRRLDSDKKFLSKIFIIIWDILLFLAKVNLIIIII